jgi:hypothetical protein
MNSTWYKQRAVLSGLMVLFLLAATFGAPLPVSAAPPSNDDFDHATPINSAPAVITMSDVDLWQATSAPDDPVISDCDNILGSYTIWYTFVPTSYGQATVDTAGSAFDTVLAIWTGQRDDLQLVACNDDAIGLQSEIKTAFKPGVKYYIEVAARTAPGFVTPKAATIPSPRFSATFMTLNLKFDQKNAVSAGKYDDKDSHWTYTGTWANVSNRKAFGESYKLSKVVNNTALIYFDGNQFKLNYTRLGTCGTMEILVDGVTLTTLSQTGTTLYQQVYTSPVLSNSLHLLELKDASKYVTVDALEVLALPDTIPPASILDLAAKSNGTYGSVELTWTATGDDGTDGYATSYEVRYSVSPITDSSTWGAATAVTTGLPVPKAPGLADGMTVTRLAPGVTYYFAVRALDDPAPDATPGGFSNSPFAMPAYPTPPATTGVYNDGDAKWVYFGTWTVPSASKAFGGSYHLSAVKGNSASFVFTGTSFILTYSTSRTAGIVDVFVDGVKITSLNQYNSKSLWQQKYTSPALTLGQHAVQFVHVSGKKVSVDAIEIVGSPITGPLEGLILP